MKFVPAIGESDFRSLRECGAGYIDKTSFISEILADMSKVLLFPRPRRFGKTINISALSYFLEKTDEDRSALFEGLAVTRDPKAMAHFQKYPTIFITFKDVKAKTFAEALEAIRARITELFRKFQFLLDRGLLDRVMAARFEKILHGTPSQQDLADSLWSLSTVLHEHYKTRVVILIDEYDTPIQTGYLNGFFDDIVLFFRNFFSAALKDNVALFKGVLTGILRVSKESLFSGLNNIETHSILSPDYATAFGFTEEEVASIIEPARLQEARTWYNGYLFGGQVIYNPWSILCYAKNGKLAPYWVNTASNELIEHLATKHGMALSAMSAALLNGEAIDVLVDDSIALRDIDKRPEALWNFLLFAGYLKLAKLVLREGRFTGSLRIPNKEVFLVYEEMFRNWLERAAAWSLVDDLVQALLQGDANKVQSLLEHILLTALSFQDGAGREPEKLYHGFVLGLLVHLEAQYAVRSNREAGYGRADVMLCPKTTGQPGVVMELKVPLLREPHTQAMQKAIEQARTQSYATELKNAGASPVHVYAMVFNGKKVWVKRVEEKKAAPRKKASVAKPTKKGKLGIAKKTSR